MDNNFNGQQPDMNQMYGQPVQPMQPDMNQMYGQPVQPDMSQMYGQQPVQPDMSQMYGQTVQPDMSQMYGQQPVQPDMSQMYGQQPAQPDMSQMYGQQPVQPDMSQMYGQQPVQPDMSQMYGQQPMQPMEAPTRSKKGGNKPPKAPKVKKPMTKGKLAGIIGGSVAGVAAIVCGVIFIPKLFKSDKEVVIDAFEKSFETTSVSYIDEVVGSEDIMKAFSENGGTIQLTYGINSIEGLEGLAGLQVSMDNTYDIADKLLDDNVVVTYDGTDILSFTTVATEDNIYLKWNDAVDAYLSLPTEDIFGALSKAPLLSEAFEEADLSDLPEISLNFFEENAAEINSGYVDAIEALWDKAEFKKQGKKTVDVNGKDVKAKEYTITLTEENLEDALNSAMDGVSEMMTAEEDLLANSGVSAAEFEMAIQQLKSFVPSLVGGDLVVKVYIADDKVVKVTCADDINFMGVAINYDMHVDMDSANVSGAFVLGAAGEEISATFGIYDMDGNVNGSAFVEADGEKFGVQFDTTVTDDDSKYDMDGTFELVEGSSTMMSMDFEVSMDKKANSFEAKVSSADLENIEASISGSVKNIDKGSKYTIDMDKIAVSIDGMDLMDLFCTYTIDTTDTKASGIDSSVTVYDITTMTQNDLNDLLDANMDNIEAWANSVDSAMTSLIDALDFGSSYDDNWEDDDYYDWEDDDYDWEEEDYDWEDTSSDNYTSDDMTLEYDGHHVQILGSLDWLTLDYACSYFIDYYSTDESIVVEYELYDNQWSIADDILWNYENQQEMILEDQTIYVGSLEEPDYNSLKYRYVREVSEGVYLVATVTIDTSITTSSIEDCIGIMSNAYYNPID